MRNLLLALCLTFMLSFTLPGCSALGPDEIRWEELTPKQRDHLVLTRFDVAQSLVEQVLNDDAVPADAKAVLRGLEKTARTAVLSYDDAARVGSPHTADYLRIAFDSLQTLTRWLVDYGFAESMSLGVK